MKKIIALLVCVFCGCSADKPKKVDEDTIVALLACIMARNCLVPVVYEDVQGNRIARVVVGTSTHTIMYFVTSNQSIGVTTENNVTKTQVLVEDADLDGHVDRYTTLKTGETEPVFSGPEDKDGMEIAQGFYFESMKFAEGIIPQGLLESVRNQRKGIKPM